MSRGGMGPLTNRKRRWARCSKPHTPEDFVYVVAPSLGLSGRLTPKRRNVKVSRQTLFVCLPTPHTPSVTVHPAPEISRLTSWPSHRGATSIRYKPCGDKPL